MGEFVRVAGSGDIKPGHGIVAEAQGKAIALFNVDGVFHAIDNTCIHRGGPLGEGDVEGEVVTCPWHGWQFNVTTGTCVNNPSGKVEVYQVKVDGSDVKVLL
ncbi:Dioxygenase, ferredoxin subunit [Nitrospira japonica]|uniref:Dioxygenase, ferredoxin subunit n=1 Tax=Nitrospira japonica TaxID=1325564 RepID=A0A1W1I9A8_9BACT|nr:Rieske 2Fe-2S domain-containing protein [Nitrospira japonica]SLM49572.1 Dioxygenase, ferredoxin subunit [Nitrospira japonica]